MSGNNNVTNVTNFGNSASAQIIRGQGDEERRVQLTGLAELPCNTLLGESALASLLHVSTRTLTRMILRGQLPQGVKLGGKRMWIAGKVIDYLALESDRLAGEARRLSVRLVQGRG